MIFIVHTLRYNNIGTLLSNKLFTFVCLPFHTIVAGDYVLEANGTDSVT
jgi:hypothetical protein